MFEENDDCAAMLPIKVLGKKWISLIICELLMHPNSFFTDIQNEIEGKYGQKISARVLSEGLSLLEENKIIERSVISDKMPIRVQYVLTERGQDFAVIFGILKGWGLKWGDIKQKKCRSFSCIHNSVATIDIDKARELFQWTFNLNSEVVSQNELID
ncbi:winged helix-turn-helix transcriptional regulator [Candidatus Hodarchaeum mangrovi]